MFMYLKNLQYTRNEEVHITSDERMRERFLTCNTSGKHGSRRVIRAYMANVVIPFQEE